MKKGYIFIVLTAFLYSTQEIAGKQLQGFNPFQVNFMIFLIGAIILFPLAMKDIKARKLKLKAGDFGYFALCGALCVPIAMTLLQTAVMYTKASTSAVIFSTNAVFTVPFAYFILKEKVNKGTILALFVSIIGVIFVFNPVKIAAGIGQGNNDILGILIALLAAVVWSLYTVISKIRVHYYGGYVLNFFAFCFGVVFIFIILMFMGKAPVPVELLNSKTIFVLLYMGIFIKALGYIFYLGAIKETSAVTASMVFLIKPALATLIAAFAVGETIEMNVVLGIACIVAGSYISYKMKKVEALELEKLKIGAVV